MEIGRTPVCHLNPLRSVNRCCSTKDRRRWTSLCAGEAPGRIGDLRLENDCALAQPDGLPEPRSFRYLACRQTAPCAPNTPVRTQRTLGSGSPCTLTCLSLLLGPRLRQFTVVNRS